MGTTTFVRRARLLATAAPLAMLIAGIPSIAGAQTSSATLPQSSDQTADQAANEKDIVVTGSLFRRTDTETPSPVTVLTADQLEKRGINTVTEAIQRLSANGAGTLPNSFSANGAFASGASAPSLRGLTTDSTLVLFDGLRAAYYPLADDGVRNFVDINSIPDAIVERVEVLKDGASSTYGADAVAGVVNIITKKQFTGIKGNVAGGISERGDAGEQRADLTAGYGDLAEQHFNFYVSGEYQKDAMLRNSDRGYPYNTSDLSKLCGTSVGTATIAAGSTTCRTNSVVNGVQFDGTYGGIGTTIDSVVRPYNAANTAAVAGSRYQLLNAGAGCGTLNPITLTAAQAAANVTSALVNCQQDTRNLYGVIAPSQQRIGASARLTVQLGDKTQAYLSGNFYQSDVFYTGTPASIRFTSPNGGATINGALPTTTSLALPVFVCNRNGANATFTNSIAQVAGCSAATGTLNPNNPFAAQGQVARILYLAGDIPLSNERKTNSYRAAGGVDGSVNSLFDYSLAGTYMKEDLKATYKGYINLQHLLNEVADGSYNFLNPAANTQATRDYLAPTVIANSSSELYQIQLTLKKQLFQLPGGPLNIAAGGAYRHESINAPSANPANPANPYDTINLNRFGTSGSRGVTSGFFEIDAPIFTQLEINGSGRYDSYSSGQTNFSPKIGAKFTPVRQIAFRSTFSKGFRIPSFAESFGLPTTGFINANAPASYIARCTAAAGTYCNATYSLGLTSVGNPNLKPEKSTNFTAGVILEPTRNISLSVDYYNIYKKDLITGADYSPQIAAYYAGATAGTTLTKGVTGITVDNVGYGLLPAGAAPYPLLATIQYGFVNADSAKSTGIDFDLEGHFNITPTIRYSTSLDANYVIELSQTINGVKQIYTNSLGPYQTTSASGTPRWRGTWQNTVDFGSFSLTGTAYYTSGYSEGAADDGNTPDGQTCSATGSFALYRDGATVVTCRVKHFIDIDLTGQIKVNDKFTLYGNVLNVFGVSAPYDPSTYGASNYNPAWGSAGIVGRYFRVGARFGF